MFKNAGCYFQKDIVSICMNSVQELTTNLVHNPSTDQMIDL